MKQIVVFGSNILDMFFEVENFDLFTKTGKGAEDALHLATHRQAPGGKGANQAVAAAKAGGKVKFFGALGRGAHARYILDNFGSVGINTNGIIQTDLPTGCATIFTKPDGKHKIVVSQGANALAKQSQIPDKLLGPNTILLLQAELKPQENENLMVRGHEAGAVIILNVAPAKKMPAKILSCIDYLVVNEPEAEAVATHLNISYADHEQLAQIMATRFNMTCIVTLGEKGVLAIGPDKPQEVIRIPALSIKAVDTVGAGDAFCGALAAALAKDTPFETALRHAIVAGSLACTKFGAQAALPTEREIQAKLKSLKPTHIAVRPLRAKSTARKATSSLHVGAE